MTVRQGAEERLAKVKERILKAGAQVGRDGSSVALIAVSKTFSSEDIAPVLEAGHRHFGENRVQEARDKWPSLRVRFPNTVLHLIGPLQTNKVRDALSLFDCIHSVDRENLAEVLSRDMARTGKNPVLFLQVNTGLEPQKSGIAPKTAPEFVQKLRLQHGLRPEGLMCIPPEAHDPGPHFAMLRQIAKECELPLLSMGMSGDFEAAIKLGATHIRVGSAIFGERQIVSSM